MPKQERSFPAHKITNSLPFYIVLLLSCCQSRPSQLNRLNWTRFEWVQDSLDGRQYDRAYMYLPARIQGIPHDFTFQLDLGYPETVVYENSIKPYLELYPQNLDTTLQDIYLDKSSLFLDKDRFTDIRINYLKDYGAFISLDSVQSSSPKHIGTIGVNLFQDSILIIDYPNQCLTVTSQIPSYLASQANFIDITLDESGLILLPMSIQNRQQDILFDTGSSMFHLITAPRHWTAATSQQIVDSVLVTTWGHEYYIHGAVIDNVKLGNQLLPSAVCYSNEYLADFMEEKGIWGIAGNAYFFDSMIIIDFKNKKFGYVKELKKAESHLQSISAKSGQCPRGIGKKS